MARCPRYCYKTSRWRVPTRHMPGASPWENAQRRSCAEAARPSRAMTTEGQTAGYPVTNALPIRDCMAQQPAAHVQHEPRERMQDAAEMGAARGGDMLVACTSRSLRGGRPFGSGPENRDLASDRSRNLYAETGPSFLSMRRTRWQNKGHEKVRANAAARA